RLLTSLDPGVYGRRGTFLTFEPASFVPDRGLLDLLGVAALIAPAGTRAPGGDFSLAWRGDDADVYARPWSPPARVVASQERSTGFAGRVDDFRADGTRWTIG